MHHQVLSVSETSIFVRRKAPLAALGLFGATAMLGASSGGSVAGAVVDADAKPVAGARVLISQAVPVLAPVATPPIITGPLAATAVADVHGSFQLNNLAPGQYIACAEAAALGYLDPCHWSTAAPSFTVTAGQAVSGIQIVMAAGAVLRVHVDDPQQFLKPVSGPVDFDFEVHVVTNKELHYSAPITSRAGTARDHAITIPFNTPVTLRVLSGLSVNDQSGRPFSAAGAAINVPEATPSTSVSLTIAGKK